jgi:hypothetical protein
MKRTLAAVLTLSMLAPSFAFAVDSNGAAYFGGTAAFKDAKNPVEGALDTKNETALIFTAHDKAFKGQQLSIPYANISDLEFGQKAGRRVGAAVATTALLGPIGLVTLFSKKKNHFLTVSFTDENSKDQVAVLELGKDIVRTTIPVLEARSGKKVTFQDDDARKSAK